MLDLVGPGLDAAYAIAQLPGLGTQLAAQTALRFVHVRERVRLMHGQRCERVAGAGLGQITCLLDGFFQLAAQGGVSVGIGRGSSM